MGVRPGEGGIRLEEGGLDALAESGLAVGRADTLAGAMGSIADAVARSAGAEVVVVRVVDEPNGCLNAEAVATASAALAAELEGSRVRLEDVPRTEESDLDRLPEPIRRAAKRVRAEHVVLFPVQVDGLVRGTLELMRSGEPFDESERRLGRLGAAQAGLAIRAFGVDGKAPRSFDVGDVLTLAGDALAASADEARTAEGVARLAVEATGATFGLVWESGDDDSLELVASHGPPGAATPATEARARAEEALAGRVPVVVEELGDGHGADGVVSATMQLGHPPIGALQLVFDPADAPGEEILGALATFGVRAAQALRASVRSRVVTLELERTQALLAIVAQAISQLSLAHTLETAVQRVGELLGSDRLAVYLREDERLYEAAGVGLAGPHVRVAERLLELTLGPFRSRGVLVVRDVAADPRLAAVREAAGESGIRVAVAVPLLAQEDVVGLLGIFPSTGRGPTESERALVAALAAQLAVAVQNAQLHERAKRLSEERERALEAERAASRRVGALYEISRSFAQSLSLEATLQAFARTAVEILDVDVAIIGLPDERRDWLVPHALEVSESRLEDAVRAVACRPLPFGAQPIQRLFRQGQHFALTRKTARQVGAPATALLPFFERGWTGAAVPIATPAEVLASLTILSVRPGSPVTQETIEEAKAIAGQAALAIDNARLYQQQKQFADTMQRSLLPRSIPKLEGLELGDAYESSARVEVGGDVYDFMELADGRLAVALGDVTGHGIEAAADMAMAKFVFRSLAREHPEPADFLESANDVVVGEIAPGKFITMVYLVVDADGHVAAAGAGHPPPRVVSADGTVTGLEAGGLVLGVDPGQEYSEVHGTIEPGGAVVLYTDGVIEARRDGELYGLERLDALLAERRALPATALAEAVLEECRAFARGDLADDCAVVVVKKTA